VLRITLTQLKLHGNKSLEGSTVMKDQEKEGGSKYNGIGTRQNGFDHSY